MYEIPLTQGGSLILKIVARKVTSKTGLLLLATRGVAASPEFGLEKHGHKCPSAIFFSTGSLFHTETKF